MLTKRIIACLDIKDGRTVKGIEFKQIRDIGDPVELACYYSEQGIDELVFLDITATQEKRKTFAALVREVARAINIPFTVGGGISSIEDVRVLLEAGADKISVNTSAVKKPELINQLAREFGSQCIVTAVDTKFENNDWYVYINGGSAITPLKTIQWIQQAASLGAGELMVTSIDRDGTRNGFDLQLSRIITELVQIPLIASGGAGKKEHFANEFIEGKAEAALAAGIFHEKKLEIPELKQYLKSQSIPVRL